MSDRIVAILLDSLFDLGPDKEFRPGSGIIGQVIMMAAPGSASSITLGS
jgi:hypothetical protein